MKVLKNNSLTIISIQNKFINPGDHKLEDLNIDEIYLNQLINELPGLKLLFDNKILQLEEQVTNNQMQTIVEKTTETIVEEVTDNVLIEEVVEDVKQEVKVEVNDNKKNKKKK